MIWFCHTSQKHTFEKKKKKREGHNKELIYNSYNYYCYQLKRANLMKISIDTTHMNSKKPEI